MQSIPDKSIGMILCDLPYGTTACKWDTIIPFEPLWKQYKRIIKDRGAIVLFGSEPFSSYLRMSNIKDYKYDWIWDKKKSGNIFLVHSQPMKVHEIITVFNSSKEYYYPIMELRDKPERGTECARSSIVGGTSNGYSKVYTHKYPKSIITVGRGNGREHPTQKPVALLEYLIKTYTLEGETVLDNTMGSGSTGVACVNTHRDFIGIELDKTYFDIATKRIEESKGLFFESNDTSLSQV